MHSTKILFFDLAFTDLTISRCIFPDDIFNVGIHGQCVLSVHKFSPIHILFLHSVLVKAPRPSTVFRVRDFYKWSCYTWEMQLLPGMSCTLTLTTSMGWFYKEIRGLEIMVTLENTVSSCSFPIIRVFPALPKFLSWAWHQFVNYFWIFLVSVSVQPLRFDL